MEKGQAMKSKILITMDGNHICSIFANGNTEVLIDLGHGTGAVRQAVTELAIADFEDSIQIGKVNSTVNQRLALERTRRVEQYVFAGIKRAEAEELADQELADKMVLTA
jgi:hypothetical protein